MIVGCCYVNALNPLYGTLNHVLLLITNAVQAVFSCAAIAEAGYFLFARTCDNDKYQFKTGFSLYGITRNRKTTFNTTHKITAPFVPLEGFSSHNNF